MDDHKFSLRSSFGTGASSCANDASRHYNHSWKCYINPSVNYQYHQIMLQRSPSFHHKIRSISKRPVSHHCFPKSQKIIPSSKKRFPSTLDSQRQQNKAAETEYGSKKTTKKYENIGIQTRTMAVLEPSELVMKEEERKYLRDRFIDHYQIGHGRKF